MYVRSVREVDLGPWSGKTLTDGRSQARLVGWLVLGWCDGAVTRSKQAAGRHLSLRRLRLALLLSPSRTWRQARAFRIFLSTSKEGLHAGGRQGLSEHPSISVILDD